MNDFSYDEIINSVEYQWRKHQAKLYLLIWMIVSMLTLFVPLFVCLSNLSMIGYGMLIWLAIVLLYGVIFGSFSLYSYNKASYLKKNYKNFSSYEIKLDTISTSYMYRGATYYSVTVESRKVIQILFFLVPCSVSLVSKSTIIKKLLNYLIKL